MATQKNHTNKNSKRWLALAMAFSFAALVLLVTVGPMVARPLPGATDPDGDIEADGDFSAPKFSGAWTLKTPANHSQIMGYASSSNVMPGNSISLDVSCSTPAKFKTDIFRMGYYTGVGALETGQIGYTACSKQSAATTNITTGLVDTSWKHTQNLAIPKSWQPGYYLARLTSTSGYQSYVPFLVSSPKVTSKYLFVDAVNTSEAYNNWGGNSLYVGSAANGRATRAFKVSLNRPYASNNGAGEFLDWEYSMVKFLEQKNYNVDYATDIQINDNPSLLQKYKAIILVGHDEYWTWPMLDAYKAAVQHGTNLAVFASNTDYRPTRIEADPTSHQADRVVVCYKAYGLDPQYESYQNALAYDYQHMVNLTNLPTVEQYQVTGYNWRDFPFSMPESELLGGALLGLINGSAPLTVSDASSWVFNNTGLKNGDNLPGLVGYEYDTYTTQLPVPKHVDILFSSKVEGDTSNATIYTNTSGGQVFNAGTNQWSWGLDKSLNGSYSPALIKVTSNILNNFGG